MVDSCVFFLPNINQRNPKKGEKTVNKEPSNTNHNSQVGQNKIMLCSCIELFKQDGTYYYFKSMKHKNKNEKEHPGTEKGSLTQVCTVLQLSVT